MIAYCFLSGSNMNFACSFRSLLRNSSSDKNPFLLLNKPSIVCRVYALATLGSTPLQADVPEIPVSRSAPVAVPPEPTPDSPVPYVS